MGGTFSNYIPPIPVIQDEDASVDNYCNEILDYYEWKKINLNLLEISLDISNKYLTHYIYITIYKFAKIPSSKLNSKSYNPHMRDVCKMFSRKYLVEDMGLIICGFLEIFFLHLIIIY